MSAAGNLKIVQEAFVEKVKVLKNGKKVKTVVPATKVFPGDTVIYVFTYTNVGGETATDIKINNKIDKNMTYVSSSGDANEINEVSVNGGKKYGQLKNLKKRSKGNKERVAAVGDVTHVRWVLAKALAPKAGGKVRLRATVN